MEKKHADLRAKRLASFGCALYPGGGRLSAVGTGFPSCAADAKWEDSINAVCFHNFIVGVFRQSFLKYNLN